MLRAIKNFQIAALISVIGWSCGCDALRRDYPYLRPGPARCTGARCGDKSLGTNETPGTKLRGTKFNGADLRGTIGLEKCIMDSNTDFSGALRDPSDPPIPGWIVVEGKLQRSGAKTY